MKWVYIGIGQATIFVLAAAWFDKSHRVAILSGGALAAIIMYFSYAHAKAAGLSNPGPTTEPTS